MSWSLVETRALAAKATRGAGFSWGLAEDAGFAVQWLQSHGAPGVEALAKLLEWTEKSENRCSPVRDGGKEGKPDAPFNPLELGAALMDAKRCGYSGLGHVCQPLLLVPFIAASAPKNGCRLTLDDNSIVLGADCVFSTANREALLPDSAFCVLSAMDDDLPASVRQMRVPEYEKTAIERLGRFAARTLAPATEASRMAGAGAGLTDND
ncbi:MAG: DUF3726 domain-containing protein [Rhizobiaceae bacterium]